MISGKEAVGDDYEEANEDQHKRDPHARKQGRTELKCLHVHDACLHRRHEAATADRQNKASRPQLGIVSQPFESEPIDGGEHQRHTSGNTDQAIEPRHPMNKNGSKRKPRRTSGQGG